HIWATWCKPCKEEFPLFNALYQRFRDKEAVLLPVAIDEGMDRDALASFAKGLGAAFPVYLAKEGGITDRYWRWGVPVTYVIDKKGSIAGRALGPRDWASKETAELIEALIKE
ncbi:MAG: TlpA family protein disulfide reductase, partial [Deltaproteobacteria bacterium]|nr:TlpA family protein disulfide reductase [Deltaproteobacteria bacterium]